MKNGFYIDEQNQLEFVGTGQISIGDGMQLDQRYANDYSKRPQSIVRRRKKTARTATVTLQIARSALMPELNVFDVVDDFSALAGQTGDLYWNEAREGKFCVRGVSFSFALDAVDIVSAVQVSLELTESYTPEAKKKRVKAEYSLF
ncbi:MAG: hypothetical protein IKY83_12030 [Proteobacteria bacterium]|nr:hypothetical protein [Pseudomonadota bacterium]